MRIQRSPNQGRKTCFEELGRLASKKPDLFVLYRFSQNLQKALTVTGIGWHWIYMFMIWYFWCFPDVRCESLLYVVPLLSRSDMSGFERGRCGSQISTALYRSLSRECFLLFLKFGTFMYLPKFQEPLASEQAWTKQTTRPVDFCDPKGEWRMFPREDVSLTWSRKLLPASWDSAPERSTMKGSVSLPETKVVTFQSFCDVGMSENGVYPQL